MTKPPIPPRHHSLLAPVLVLLIAAALLASVELIQRRQLCIYEKELSEIAKEVESSARIVTSGYRQLRNAKASDVRVEGLRQHSWPEDDGHVIRWELIPSSVNIEHEHRPAFALTLSQSRFVCAWSTTITLTLWWTMEPPFLLQLEDRLRAHGLKYRIVDRRS